MSSPDCVAEWQEIPADPDPDDLGYDRLELDFTHSAPSGHYVVLPQDEAFLRKEAFVVVDSDAMCNVIDHR